MNAAVELCGADSAGISIEREDGSEQEFYHWVATAGEYTGFLNAILPREPSACGVCLERGRPQLFRVSKRFFDILGVTAPLVSDGLLLPWRVDGMRGTIFVMAHGRTEAFDKNDCRTMEVLADFAATGVRQQRQHAKLLEQTAASAAAAMANDLAHKINNPLQGFDQHPVPDREWARRRRGPVDGRACAGGSGTSLRAGARAAGPFTTGPAVAAGGS